MASRNSFLKTYCHFNKVFLNGRYLKLHPRKLPPIVNPACTIFSSNTVNPARSIFSSSNTETTKPDTETTAESSELQLQLAEKEELLEASKKEALDFKDKYYRALAEGENIRRRGVKQVSDTKLYAIQGLAKDLLDVADVLEKATSSVPPEEYEKNEHLKQLFNGVTMTETELQKVFKKHGLEKVDPLNEAFDPNFHEAMFQIPMEGKTSGTVAIVQKVGYKLHGRALRAAQVGVVP